MFVTCIASGSNHQYLRSVRRRLSETLSVSSVVKIRLEEMLIDDLFFCLFLPDYLEIFAGVVFREIINVHILIGS